MTPGEKAREIADHIQWHCDTTLGETDLRVIATAIREAEAAVWSRMRDTVEATAREARNAALEEAAKVAKKTAIGLAEGFNLSKSFEAQIKLAAGASVADQITAQIRALKDKTP
jgi:hypothetical protein